MFVSFADRCLIASSQHIIIIVYYSYRPLLACKKLIGQTGSSVLVQEAVFLLHPKYAKYFDHCKRKKHLFKLPSTKAAQNSA